MDWYADSIEFVFYVSIIMAKNNSSDYATCKQDIATHSGRSGLYKISNGRVK